MLDVGRGLVCEPGRRPTRAARPPNVQAPSPPVLPQWTVGPAASKIRSSPVGGPRARCPRGGSSVGRALRSQCRGRGFDSLPLHSTRFARSWQAMPRASAASESVSRLEDCEANVLSLSKDDLMYFVYILQCCDGSYYVGSTQNIARRLDIHCSGQGPAFTARRLPVRLVYQEPLATREEAVRRERQLKGWSRAKKEAIISGDLKLLSELAACRAARQ